MSNTPPQPKHALQSAGASLPAAAIVIPCYNHGRFVADAARSALQQPGARTQVVIVDDGSTDGCTPAQCDACLDLPGARDRLAVVHQPNRGLPAARNRGASESARAFAAPAPLLVFLDADDWIEPDFVARLARALADADDQAISHAYCQERLTDQATGIWTVPEWDPLLLMVTNLHPVTCLVRRDRFDEVGGFDESMRLGYEDWDLWVRFASRGWRGVRVREPLFNWRRHSQSTMVHDAVQRHEDLFRTIVRNNRAFYDAHREDVLVRSNALLRACDGNWLDENLEAIQHRDDRKWIRDLIAERDGARAHAADLAARVGVLETQLADLNAKPALRVSRALHALVERLPSPVAAAARRTLSMCKKLAAPRAR